MEFKLIQYQGKDRLTCSVDSFPEGIRLAYHLPETRDLVWPSYCGLFRADRLWLSTCFELFLGTENQSHYIELNVTPSGAWNCYHFDKYRSGMRESGAWDLQEVEIRNGVFSATFLGQLTSRMIRVAPAVILQLKSAKLDYFAISHAAQPDFHDPGRHVFVSANDL